MKRRPGPLWMFFYGRPRTGFPWLVAGILLAVVVFAVIFGLPGESEAVRVVSLVLGGLLLAAALVLAMLAVVVPRRRR